MEPVSTLGMKTKLDIWGLNRHITVFDIYNDEVIDEVEFIVWNDMHTVYGFVSAEIGRAF